MLNTSSCYNSASKSISYSVYVQVHKQLRIYYLFYLLGTNNIFALLYVSSYWPLLFMTAIISYSLECKIILSCIKVKVAWGQRIFPKFSVSIFLLSSDSMLRTVYLTLNSESCKLQHGAPVFWKQWLQKKNKRGLCHIKVIHHHSWALHVMCLNY